MTAQRVRFSELCTFTDKQWEATRTADSHKYTLFGGSRGPGKSHWLRWYAIRRLMAWAARGMPGVRVGMFCEDYPSLQDRQISKLAKFPRWLGELKTTKTDGLGFYLNAQYGGGVVLLRNLQDGTRYQSAEFAGILIDELTKNPLGAFDDLRGSLRWPGIDDTFFAAATNPNGRYFKWVRQAWVERDFTGPIAHLAEIEGQFAYVKALPEDNPHLEADYWTMLNSLPDRLRDAWRDGSWYVAVEGLVFDTFTEDNITDEEPDPERTFELGIDDGYIDPRATLFIQNRGAYILVFDELYQTKRLEEETVGDILLRCAQYAGAEAREAFEKRRSEYMREHSTDFIPNAELAHLAYESGVSLPEIAAVSHEAIGLQRRLREADIPARNWMAVRAPGRGSTRAAAVKATRALICDGNQYRAIRVHRRCKHLIDEITTGYRNKEDGGGGYLDQPEDGNDHAVEALEGWVWLRTRH